MSDYISPIILDRIPTFIQDEYPSFVQFLTDYLGFMERDEGFIQVLNDWKSNMEPSNNVDVFLDAILRDCGFVLKRPITVPKSTLLHVLRDFMLSRGSRQSFDILFRILFGVTCSIDYPRDRMLVPSEAAWVKTSFIFTGTNVWLGTPQMSQIISDSSSYGGTVVGSKSKASANIQDIQTIDIDNKQYLQIQISTPLVEFDTDELIQITCNGTTISEPLIPVIDLEVSSSGSGYMVDDSVSVLGASPGRIVVNDVSSGPITSITIQSGGSGYAVGDVIVANGKGYGSGFSAYVTTVSGSGAITSINISSPGYNYSSIPSLRVVSTTGSGAAIIASSTEIGKVMALRTIVPYLSVNGLSGVSVLVQSNQGSGALFNAGLVSRFETSRWTDQKGVIGFNTTVQDSNKYQTFSYRLLSSVDPSGYQDIVSDLLHPVGFVKTFVVSIDPGEVSLSPTANFDLSKSIMIESPGVTFGYSLSDFTLTSVAEPNNLVGRIDSIGTFAAITTSDHDEIYWH